MSQASLLPVICDRTKPPPGVATAAADFIAIDDTTTHRWLCKGQSKHADVPITEWLCSKLAAECGLPVPEVSVIELRSAPGIPYFGSQWLGGARDFIDVMGRISNPSIFARTHAVDLFVHNTDRHRNNFLFLELAGDVVARVIDFSHSLYVMGWPLPSLPMSECNTTRELSALLAQDPATYVKPQAVVDRLGALDDQWLAAALAPVPPQWLDPTRTAALKAWWASPARQTRVVDAQSCLP